MSLKMEKNLAQYGLLYETTYFYIDLFKLLTNTIFLFVCVRTCEILVFREIVKLYNYTKRLLPFFFI